MLNLSDLRQDVPQAPTPPQRAELYIFSVATDCWESFANLLAELDNNVPLTWRLVTEYQQRYEAWIGFLGVFADGNLSLDHRLRNSAEVKSLVIQQLHLAKKNLVAAFELVKKKTADDDPATHLVEENHNVRLSPPLKATFNGVEGALDRLHRLGVAIRQASAGQLMSRIKPFDQDERVGSFEMLAYSLLESLYPSTNPRLLEHVSASLSQKYKVFLYLQERGTQYRPSPGRFKPRTIQVQSGSEVDSQKKIEASSSTNPKPETHQRPGYFRKYIQPSVRSSAFDEDEFMRKQSQTTPILEQSAPPTTSVAKGLAGYLPLQAVPDKAMYADCEWCRENQLAKVFTTPSLWKEHVKRDWKPYVCIAEDCAKLHPVPSFAGSRQWERHMRKTHSARWSRTIYKQPTWICDIDSKPPAGHIKTLRFATELEFLEHIQESHGPFTSQQLQTMAHQSIVFLNRAEDICPFCCFLIEDDSSPEEAKAGKRNDPNLGKDLHDIPEESTDSDEQDPDMKPELSASKRMAKHVARHMQTFTFLVVRLLSLPKSTEKEKKEEENNDSVTFADTNPSEAVHSDYQKWAKEDLPPDLPLPHQIIRKYVDSKFDPEVKRFLPASCMDELITSDTVIKEIFGKDELAPEDLDLREGPTISELVGFVLSKAKKVFAITILSGLRGKEIERAVFTFMRADFTDSSLPVKEKSAEEDIGCFRDTVWSKVRIHNFCREQWSFLAPIFPQQNFVIDLEPEHILPFTERSSALKEGAFSQVFQVELHRAHCKDPYLNGKGNLAKFAIKQFMPPPDSKLEDDIDWIWEPEVMLLEEIRGLSHPNLTQGIAAIRRGRERYVMFPWADGGNLRDLWIDNPEPKVTAGLVRDIIEQLLGMAEALMRLHFWTDQPHVRHGNIKPENILVFPTGDKSCIGTLELSDVGSVRDHSARTQLRSRNSGNSYGTVKYEPPESVTKKLSPRSRLSDIWSMGCVTVEFMVWLLYGYEELKEFNAHISGKLEEPSRFFVVDQIEDQGQQGTFPQLVANVHPAVQACIDHMSKDKECVGETALGDLLNIVKTKLLVVELPNQTVSATAMMENPSVTITNYSSKEPRFGRVRANASQLVHALEEIMQRGIASNERYWLTGHDRDNVRLPRVTLRNITKGRSYYLSPERTLEQHIPGQFDPLVDENGLNEQGEREVVIAVMGVTGAGKSYLIRQVTGQDVVVGDGIAASTQNVFGVRVKYRGVKLTMIDSPGFDNTYRTDTEVLSDISTYLSRTYSQGFKLSGIIYLHPISQARMDDSSLRSLRMLRELVGDYALGNVVLATSHWSRVSSEEGIRRETELKNTFWKDLISRGAIMTRYSGDQRSGNALIDLLIDKRRIVLHIQRELVDEGKKLIETTAGHVLNEEIIKLQKKHEEELKKLKEEMDAAMRNRDKNAQEELAELKKELERQIDLTKRERENVKE